MFWIAPLGVHLKGGGGGKKEVERLKRHAFQPLEQHRQSNNHERGSKRPLILGHYAGDCRN